MPVSRNLASRAGPASFHRLLLALATGLGLAFSGALSAQAACTGPAPLEAKVRAQPGAAAWIELGNWYGEHQQFSCALSSFRSALRLQPKSAQIHYLIGLSLYETGEVSDAVDPLRRSIQLDPSVTKPHLLLAAVFTRLGQPAAAEPEFRAALAIDPKSQMALHGLAAALGAQQKFRDVVALLRSAPLDEGLALALADAEYQLGDELGAVNVLSEAMKTSPHSVRLSTELVTLYTKVTRTLDAEHLAEQTYEAHPDDPLAQISYLRILVLNGDWDPAKPVGAKLLAESPHDFDTLYLNGVLERQEGDYSAARQHLTEAIAINANQGSAHANLGIALARLNDAADARVELQKAIDLGKPEPETYFELANVLRALGQTDAAKDEMLRYQKAVKENNDTVLAISKAGEAAQALQKGDVAHAVDLYRQAFAAAPDNALIGYKLSTALDQSGDLDGERTVLEQVVAIDPTIALAQNQLGYIDSQRGDYASAEQHFRLAVTAAPQFAQAWISLAATLGVEARYPAAQQAIAKALELDPGNTQAQQLSHELAAAQSKNPPAKN